jgi:hypothetical protein
MAGNPFAVRHRWDSRFWAVFLATSWLAIAIGFWHPIEQRFFGSPDYAAPPVLVLHVWTYFGWMMLLTIQAILIGQGQVGVHRKIGLAGAVLAVAVVGTGLGAEIFSQRFWARTDPGNVRFFTFPLYVLLAFAICAFLAIRARRNPPVHKRLILMATIAVMGGPYMRWWGATIDRFTGAGPFNTWAHHYVGMDVLLIAAALYDRATRGTVHPVYRAAIPLLLAGQVAANLIWHSDWWPPLVRHALGIPPA